MSGIAIWIVLGGLVGLVAIFLVVTTILDRKKRKKIVAAEKKQEAEAAAAFGEVLYYLNAIIENNEKLLKNFVPSVGKIKMSDIRNKSKEALKKLHDSKEFKMIENREDSQKIVEVFKSLKSLNSNTWTKTSETSWVLDEFKKLETDAINDDYKKFVKEELKDIY